MNEISLIFPHQLFRNNPAIDKSRKIYLIEDPLFFGDSKYPLAFHKKKLVFHRASMKAYEKYLHDKGYEVVYLNYAGFGKDIRTNYLAAIFNKVKVNSFHYADVTDFILEKRLQKLSKSIDKPIVKYESPMFLTDEKFFRDFFSKQKTYLMASFYIEQRKRLNILIDNNKPVGGKWSFDDENRKKLPADIRIPKIKFPEQSEFVIEAIEYIEKYFPDNPGSSLDFQYPVTFEQADEWLDDLLNNRLRLFGDYEDAIDKNEKFLFHSLLTPLLNSGLLTPSDVLNQAMIISKKKNIPLNSLEGFIRQIIGWREYIRAIYVLEGVKQRTTNFFGFKNKMPQAFYQATTGVKPVDNVISNVLDNAYSHHIERLMILGNFMLLCEIDPDEVYKWFMEMYIDAYDWVMVPNVYGMSQYADGGLICTKPYISSSNYIRKMSNFEKGDWCDIWDSLFWRFIYKHKKVFEKNPRMSMMVVQLNRMEKEKLNSHLKTAESFLKKLFNND